MSGLSHRDQIISFLEAIAVDAAAAAAAAAAVVDTERIKSCLPAQNMSC